MPAQLESTCSKLFFLRKTILIWRGDRVAEGAGLEITGAGNRTEGSNPSLSATQKAFLLPIIQ